MTILKPFYLVLIRPHSKLISALQSSRHCLAQIEATHHVQGVLRQLPKLDRQIGHERQAAGSSKCQALRTIYQLGAV